LGRTQEKFVKAYIYQNFHYDLIMPKKPSQKNCSIMWGTTPNFSEAIRFGPAAARSERVRRNIRKSRVAKNQVQAQYEARGWRVTPRDQRKGGADFEAERFDLWKGIWERETVKAKAGSGQLTKKQRAEKRRTEKAGGNYVVARVRSLWPFW
jgi:hypothetical protein